MKPSLLNAPFDPKEYQRRMDQIIRVKHGFATQKVVAPERVIAVPEVQFYKWPAYITPFYVRPSGARLGFFGSGSAVGKQYQDGRYEYITYAGDPKTSTGGSVQKEYGTNTHRLISPDLCRHILRVGHEIIDPEEVKALMEKYPSLTLKEWEALPDDTWPGMRDED